MSEKTPTHEELTEIVGELLKQGQSPKEIRQMMYQQYSSSYAETNTIIQGYGISTKTVYSNSGSNGYPKYKGMPQDQQLSNKAIVGLIIMVIGIVITVGSFTNAISNPDGGRYIIAWGAIIFGGIIFVRGWLE